MNTSPLAWKLFIASVIGSVAVLAVVVLEHELWSDKAFLAVLVAMIVLVLTERWAAVVKDHEDASANHNLKQVTSDLHKLAQGIPKLLSDGGHLVRFDSTLKAQEHINDAAQDAVIIRNTVLRYGERAIISPTEQVQSWLDTKVQIAETGKVLIRETTSAHLKGTKDFEEFLSRIDGVTGAQREAVYQARYIDDVALPMMQFTIISFEDKRKSVYFGWQYGPKFDNSVFLSTNEELVEFFIDYFDRHWAIAIV